ncbi:sugar ABC transporter substrate-binding protein [Pseudomonas oryzihabitans]|uniref:Inositol transport system substrate-binding protein n=1 Tax=Pseudomonas oryzihabitans TaxID=47885 RepID=A0AAJ2F033_9PSED|nr:sugar ABC transporter substrate-binding protein [Pseudomonas psychrotolerans]MDR6235065.1 inositol transport system substrate-binding protein [Pseudomonas psychrotolerans]MDR6355727.1 inositol transport system substrate-binding protein [Pseudomonas psychrotolerans]
MKRVCLLVISTLFSTLALADLRIGVSIAQFDDNFLTYLREAMADEAKREGGVQLQFEDARGDVVRQLSQVESFVNQKVDAVVVTPVDTAATRNMTAAAKKAGIPLLYVNRRPQEELPAGVVYIGSNEKLAGRLQMEALAQKMGGKGNLAIMLGLLSNDATHGRTAGVKEVLAKYPDIKVVEEQTAEWQRDKGMDLMSNWLTSGRQIDAVASNNDEMAIGAAMALRQAGKQPGKDVFIGGVDGTPDGLAALQRGLLTVTVFHDAKGQGRAAIENAVKAARKESVPAVVDIPFELVTADNVAQFKNR